MTGSIDKDKSNLKKLMRVALVGIRPADQVLLKGYLRVLLRLEADLEWVSASHASVDLFMINKEFAQAASIIKLLESQPQKPVLYTSRSDTDKGWIKDDQLVLPLTGLNELNEWLLYSVAALKQGAGAVTDILQKNQPDDQKTSRSPATIATNEAQSANPSKPAITNPAITKPSHKPNDQFSNKPSNNSSNKPSSTTSATINSVNNSVNSNVKRKASPLANASATMSSTAKPSAAMPNSIRAQDYQELIILIQQLQKRPVGLYCIAANKQTIAIVEPSQARVWLPENADNQHLPTKLSLDWQLQSYIGERPHDNQAADLLQYLWQYAWMRADLLLPLVSDEADYQLRYWIKPVLSTHNSANGYQTLAKKDRKNLLTIMTALEFAPCNINQLAALANISVISAKRIVGSLLFSGSLQESSYNQLYVKINRAPLLASANKANDRYSVTQSNANQNSVNQDHNNQNGHQAPDKSAAEPATIKTSASASAQSAQQQKHGFLASLRDKLGL